MADRRTPKRKNETEPKASTAKKARGTSVASRASSVAESHDDATQTTNLDAHGAEVHWEWESEEEVITKTTITEDRIIALRSKTISTPIQRSVLAVSHIYSHGRQLHDGDIGRLVNADEDEVLEVDSDNESEISTPARRLYQRGSIGGSGRSAQSDTAPVRRSSRARDNETTSVSGLQSLEHTSNTSRSSRRSSGSARITAPVVAAAATSSSSTSMGTGMGTSVRRTSSAATTAALTIATPNRRRSVRGDSSVVSSAASSAASTPTTSRASSPTTTPLRNTSARGRGRGRGSAASSVVLAPAVVAFNQSNEEYVPPDNSYDDEYLPDANTNTDADTNATNAANANANNNADNNAVNGGVDNVVEEGEEHTLVQRVVRVVTTTLQHYLKSLSVVLLVVLVCIVAVYIRSALNKPPTHISVVDTFKYDVKHVNTTSNTTLLIQEQLDAHRAELERINAQLHNTTSKWNDVVRSAEGSVSSIVSSVSSAAIEALDSFATDTTTLDTHLHTLQAQANTTATTLLTTLHTLRTDDANEVLVFNTKLTELTPQVADLTTQAQELNVLVDSGVSVLRAVVEDLPHYSSDSISAGVDSEGSDISIDDVVTAARAAEAHIITINTAKTNNNTLLNTTVTATTLLVDRALHTLHTLQANYTAAHESLVLRADEALKVHNALQAEGIARAQASVDAALQATLQNEELRVQYETQAALVREAERLAEEERLLADKVNVLSSREAEGFVRATAEPLLNNNVIIDTLRTTLTEEVSSVLNDVVNEVLEKNRVHNIDTINSEIVQNTVRAHNKAQTSQSNAIHLHKHTTSTDDDNTDASGSTNDTSGSGEVEQTLPLEDYAVGVRGGSVIHYRRKPKGKPSLTTKFYEPPKSSDILSVVSGKHRGNKKHTPFPRSTTASVVINHHRPTVDGFYPLDMHANEKGGHMGSVNDGVRVRSDGKSISVESIAHMTLVLNDLTHVYSIKLVHATRNTSSTDIDSSSDSSTDISTDSSSDSNNRSSGSSVVQACAPRHVRFVGWTDDPTSGKGTGVDLGNYTFDNYVASDSYVHSDSSGEGTAVYEQEFHVLDHLRKHSSSVGSVGSVGSGSVGSGSVGVSTIAKAPLFKAVTMHVSTNHGEEHFTCVHRIQVLGVLQRDVQDAVRRGV